MVERRGLDTPVNIAATAQQELAWWTDVIEAGHPASGQDTSVWSHEWTADGYEPPDPFSATTGAGPVAFDSTSDAFGGDLGPSDRGD
jgi:hypothetical protein